MDPEWVDRTFARIEALVLAGDAAGLAGEVAELAALRAAEGLPVTPSS